MDFTTMLWAANNLIPLANDAAQTAPFTHDRPLILVSMGVAVAGAYAALELGARSTQREGAGAYAWLAAAGFVLGAGAFAMHFVGLAALETPLMRGFEPTPTIVSCLIALSFATTGFMLGGPRFRPLRYAAAGLWFGVGGILMHYLGMRGLIIDAELTYQPLFVLGTSIGAVLSSAGALWLCTFRRPVWMQIAIAFPMGAVIASLHFFDMAGAVLTPSPRFSAASEDMGALVLTTAAAMAALAIIAFLAARWNERGEARGAAPWGRPAKPEPRQKAWDAVGEDGVVIVPDVSPTPSIHKSAQG